MPDWEPRRRWAVLGLLLGCAPKTGPVESPQESEDAAASSGAAGEGASSGGSAGGVASPPVVTPESCAQVAQERGDPPCARWTVRVQSYCAGPAPPPDMPTSWSRCVCDACASDSDCADEAEGRCRELSSRSCGAPSVAVCLYPGHDCYDAEACPRTCLVDDDGTAACTEPYPPPP